MFDRNAMWICFVCFFCCLLPSLFTAKSVNAKSAYIGNAKSFYTKGISANNICIRRTYARNVFFAIGAYIKGTGSDDTSTKSADRKSAYARDTYTIK